MHPAGSRCYRQMSPPAHPGPIRCVTIDVEEYFHVEAAHGVVPRSAWDTLPTRVERSIDLLLDLFDRHRVRATFFTLGHVAQRHPDMVRRVHALGHEVASHGMRHDRLHRLSPAQLREDALASKRLLEDLTGAPVLGYRAPTWSITRDTAHAIDALLDTGYAYDASVFPVRHPAYGVPDAPTSPFLVRASPMGQSLLEVPPLTWRVAGRNVPVAGGGYFRLLPLRLMFAGLRQAERDARPAVLYFHPWEFDPGTPRMPLSTLGRVRTYTGLRTAAARLDRVLRSFTGWTTIASSFARLSSLAAGRPPFDLSAATPITEARRFAA